VLTRAHGFGSRFVSFQGRITACVQKRGYRPAWAITIVYDDGDTENAEYPGDRKVEILDTGKRGARVLLRFPQRLPPR
jgi:hypothetical protein